MRGPRLTLEARAAVKRIGNWTRFLGLIALAGALIGVGTIAIVAAVAKQIEWIPLLVAFAILAVIGFIPTWLLMRTSGLTEAVPATATAVDLVRVLKNLRAIFICFAILAVIGEGATIIGGMAVVRKINIPAGAPVQIPDDVATGLLVGQVILAVLLIMAIIGAIHAATTR